jgi:hypothetical protein
MDLEQLKKRLEQVRDRDQIYQSESKERAIVRQLDQVIRAAGFESDGARYNLNYGMPNSYQRQGRRLAYRLVDSLFFGNPEVWQWTQQDMVVTDNVPLRAVPCQQVSVLPEFWHIFACQPKFQLREPTHAYNCFMNRISGDRSMIFYELIRRNLLDLGLVSFNCWRPGDGRDQITHDYTQVNYQWQYEQAEMHAYATEHELGKSLIPYCSFNEDLDLSQIIVDSQVSLISETFISDSHIVLSEKLFRAIQLPRPWLLYSSPGTVALLKHHGFDVLDDMVDISYDKIQQHSTRLLNIMDQLHTFVDRTYSSVDFERLNQAAKHNQQLLIEFGQGWPQKLHDTIEKIQQL